jgi:hypothetical protein
MKWVRFAAVVFLLGTLTLQADPFKTVEWTGPDEYVNNLPIPDSDEISHRLLCGVTEGGPYDLTEMLIDSPSPSLEDMGALVMDNPGTYYCVMTATSSTWNLTSAYSNEVNFTVLPSDLGLRPKPPVLSLVSV